MFEKNINYLFQFRYIVFNTYKLLQSISFDFEIIGFNIKYLSSKQFEKNKRIYFTQLLERQHIIAKVLLRAWLSIAFRTRSLLAVHMAAFSFTLTLSMLSCIYLSVCYTPLLNFFYIINRSVFGY